jgi:hypothetical protein
MRVAKSNNPDMFITAEGCEDHDYDIVQDLNHRLDSLWRYDQHVLSAKGHTHIQTYWAQIKKQDEANIKTLKGLISEEMKMGCF